MRKVYLSVVAAVGVLSLFACGETAGSAVETGDLEVGFVSLNDSVDHIDLTLYDSDDNVYDTYVITGPDWTLQLVNVPVGTYTAEAEAHDVDDNVIYEGDAQFTVVPGVNPSVLIVLHAVGGDESYETIAFRSIIVSTLTPLGGHTVEITAEVRPGKGTPTTLSGRGPHVPAPGFVQGTFGPDGNFNASNVAQIEWTPDNESGPAWFVLIANDDAGDTAEVGVDLTVTAVGDVEIEFELNDAPTIDIEVIKHLNDAEGTHFYANVTYNDDNPGNIDYEWTYECPDVDWLELASYDFEEVWKGALAASRTGSVAAGTTQYFEFHIEREQVPGETLEDKREARDALHGDCTLSVKLVDSTNSDLEVTHEVTFDADWIEPVEN